MLTTSMWTPDWLEPEGWDSRNITLLPHHQPIRRRSHIPQPSPQILPLKTHRRKTIGEFGSFEHELPVLLAWPWINLSLLQTPTIQFVWPHGTSGTRTWVHNSPVQWGTQSAGARFWGRLVVGRVHSLLCPTKLQGRRAGAFPLLSGWNRVDIA